MHDDENGVEILPELKKIKIKKNLGALKCHQNHVQKYPQNDLRVQNLNQRNKIKINICRMFIST